MSDLTTLVAEPWPDWGLIDCGHGQKLERYGPIKVVRPEPQAMRKLLTTDQWIKLDAMHQAAEQRKNDSTHSSK